MAFVKYANIESSEHHTELLQELGREGVSMNDILYQIEGSSLLLAGYETAFARAGGKLNGNPEPVIPEKAIFLYKRE